ncbi:hypothetical protein SMD22_01460 (plasmid) [Brevibacillus halotolerans]|nr:hypothetical protein SMD22_01460 [Brevibacillus halotolerans]
MTIMNAAKERYKKQWNNKLKRIDAIHKSCLIRNEIDRRIDQFTSTIPDLSVQGKINEKMIAMHRLYELEDLKKWIQDEILDTKTLGTRQPLKIWDVLKYGEPGEVYEATNTIESWNGCEIQVTETNDGDPHLILVFAKAPKISNSRLKVGGTVDLVGAVTRADWVFVGERARVKESKRSIFITMCIEMARILRSLTDKNIYIGNIAYTQIRLDLAKRIEIVLETMSKYHGDFLANSEIMNTEYPPQLEELDILKKELQITKSSISYMNDDELAEKMEEIISLTYFFYLTWWGVWEWDKRIDVQLSGEEMLKIAKLKLLKEE